MKVKKNKNLDRAKRDTMFISGLTMEEFRRDPENKDEELANTGNIYRFVGLGLCDRDLEEVICDAITNIMQRNLRPHFTAIDEVDEEMYIVAPWWSDDAFIARTDHETKSIIIQDFPNYVEQIDEFESLDTKSILAQKEAETATIQ